MAPTPLIPNGVYKIRNGQFIGLVADLVGGNPYGLIVGTVNRPVNQFDQWRITNHGDGGNQVTIQNVSTGTFANAEQLQNAALRGSYDPTLWTVVKVDGGRFAIQSPDADFVWVLPEGHARVNIQLVHQTGKNNTKWFFDRRHG